MFPLTRPFRQVLATLMMLLLTVLPTGFVAMMAWRINRPGHVRDVEIELGRQLGMQVTLADVRYPKPGEVVYRGIVLRQEEPRGRSLAEIARADAVRVQRVDRELILSLENPRLSGESPRLVLAQLGAFLQRSGQPSFDRVNVTAPHCRVDLGREDLRYEAKEVAGDFQADPTQPTLRLAYRVPSGGGHPLRTDLRAGPTVRDAADLVDFQVGRRPPSPGPVLGVFFDAPEWLGPEATVEGTLGLRQSGSKDWEADFEGNLHEIDLGNLVARRFPRHRLVGRVRVALTKARWGERPDQGPGWVEVKGELSAGPGSIAVGLLHALEREMKFQLSPRLAQLDPRRTEVEFRALGLAFEIQPDGEIHLSGSLGAEFAPDAVLAGDTIPLASAPQGAANVHGLIKTLFPVAEASPGVLVPLTSESHILLSLPVPTKSDSKVRQTVDGN